MNTQLNYLSHKDQQLAYYQYKGVIDKPSILFLGGFMSDMQGTKAVALERYCIERNYSFIRFDYVGHGQSSGEFTDGTIGLWRDNVLAILDNLTEGKSIIIGSSMGGWLMLLAALARPERVHALIGIASAPDFTEELIWDQLTGTAKEELAAQGIYHLVSEYGEDPYPTTMTLIEEARNHLLLPYPIAIHCPVRLLHGMKDDDVPYEVSVKLAKQLNTTNVELHLIKQSDHRMSSEHDLAMIYRMIEDVK